MNQDNIPDPEDMIPREPDTEPDTEPDASMSGAAAEEPQRPTRHKKPRAPLTPRLIVSRALIYIGLALILVAGVYEAWDYPWYLLFSSGEAAAATPPPVEAVFSELPMPTLPPEDNEFIYDIPQVLPSEIEATPVPAEESGLSSDSLFPSATKSPSNAAKATLTQYGAIRIPKLKVSETVFVGTGKAELKKGCGYEIGTAHIGTQGNSVIAGHRSTTVKHPFKYLMKMAVGDLIYVTDNVGNTYTYEAIEVEDGNPWFIVRNDEIWVMDDRGEENPYCLTLITCHPYTKATHRVILWSKLVAINDEPFVAPEPEPETTPEPTPEPTPETTPEPTPEPTSESTPEPSAEPVFESETGDEPAPSLTDDSEAPDLPDDSE